jgi:hypothetical protein
MNVIRKFIRPRFHRLVSRRLFSEMQLSQSFLYEVEVILGRWDVFLVLSDAANVIHLPQLRPLGLYEHRFQLKE